MALLGHFGIEWDLTKTDAETRARIAEWVVLAKRARPLVATGRIVHADLHDPALDARGVVAHDGSTGLFTITQVTSSSSHPPAPVRLPGLDADHSYRLRMLAISGENGQSALEWAGSETVLTGRALAVTGVRPPSLMPQQACVIEANAI